MRARLLASYSRKIAAVVRPAARDYTSLQVGKKAMVALRYRTSSAALLHNHGNGSTHVRHFSGTDSKKFIQGLTTNDINALNADNPAVYAAILSPKV